MVCCGCYRYSGLPWATRNPPAHDLAEKQSMHARGLDSLAAVQRAASRQQGTRLVYDLLRPTAVSHCKTGMWEVGACVVYRLYYRSLRKKRILSRPRLSPGHRSNESLPSPAEIRLDSTPSLFILFTCPLSSLREQSPVHGFRPGRSIISAPEL